jgi:hypothetical protein
MASFSERIIFTTCARPVSLTACHQAMIKKEAIEMYWQLSADNSEC